MNKINKVNQWLKSRNDLENIILIIAAIALGIGGAFARRYYWEYRVAQCEELRVSKNLSESDYDQLENEFEANDCLMNVANDKMDSFMGL